MSLALLGKIGLGLAALTTGLALGSRRGGAGAVPLGSTPLPSPVLFGTGDEVVVPASALQGVAVPPNAGGAVVNVDDVRGSLFTGRIVAFVGAGGTTDVATPIGPVQLPTSSVSLKAAPPSDRVGRFAQIGDDVSIPARLSLAPIITDRAARAAFDQAVVGADLASGDTITNLVVRVTGAFAAAGGQMGLEGVVRGVDFVKPDGTRRGFVLPVTAPNPTSPLLRSGAVPREAIFAVFRNGTLIAPWRKA